MTLRGWQRHALDRALEHDEDGRLVWAVVVLTVGRQSGKSWLSRGGCLWRLHHAHLFGEPQTILHMANKRDTAMEVLRPAGLWALEKYGKGTVRWGNTAAGISLPSGDRWLIHAANDSAGVGYSCSMVFADEAWKIQRNVIDDAVMPTMSEREQPQLWLVSTAGDSSSRPDDPVQVGGYGAARRTGRHAAARMVGTGGRRPRRPGYLGVGVAGVDGEAQGVRRTPALDHRGVIVSA
jgi:hypothetical protein